MWKAPEVKALFIPNFSDMIKHGKDEPRMNFIFIGAQIIDIFSKEIRSYMGGPRSWTQFYLNFTDIIQHRKNIPKLNLMFVGI